jgi:hypothetical protein
MTVELSEQQRAFLDQHHSAAMITLRRDGSAAAVRIGVVLVDGKLWSSGTEGRLRTRLLRRDPRSTLFVFDGRGFGYLTLEAEVRLLEGADVPEQSVRLFRVMQNRPSGQMLWNGREISEEDFLHAMIDEQRLIYEFNPVRVYGL